MTIGIRALQGLTLLAFLGASTEQPTKSVPEYDVIETVEAPFPVDFEDKTRDGWRLVTIILVPNGSCTFNPPAPCYRTYFIR